MTRDDRIDAYIAAAQPFAQAILSHVRERVHAVVPDVQESIKWRMPAYLVDGRLLLITAGFKGHAALNFWRGQELESTHASVGALGQFGKLTSIAQLPNDPELDRLILEAADLARSAPAQRKPKHEPRPVPEMHPEFASALAEDPAAQAAFDGFSASCRREYLEWIGDAKQDSTRTKRIATAVSWIAEGKKRNWKYENC